MDRKAFFKTFLPAGVAAMMFKHALANPSNGTSKVADHIPSFLKAGDAVAITCPAGHMDAEKILPCTRLLQKWGLKVVYGKTVGKKWHRFGGTDHERMEDFQSLLDNPSIKAIIFGKGGYGTMRIIDQLNWEKFKQHPKWLVGYSDLTVVHLHVHNNLRIPTIHGNMGNGIANDDASTASLYQALFGFKTEYTVKSVPLNRTGEARGQLVGGNLTMLHACLSSKSDVDTRGKILFIEDVSEYKYTIDRMLMSLKRSGKLDHLAGLVVGQFSAMKQDAEENFTMGLEDIIMDKVKEYGYPVCFNFPAGHIAGNRALKLGVPYDLLVGREWVILNEAPPELLPPQ
ncbi:S66 peptidase family protein [Aridibaculum aurantiacum]|uniref:S66 peptidase family protein n=1 Tax=Aridibaculum aurantiacum TaxID=2810307 RepID=UPI001A96FA8C|nr:LD-carboxypeptidase [Aridibaculum aurantiacum]